jgi:hypothetical protein
MVKLLNRAKMSISSTGTGPITLAAAVVNFQTFAQAGAMDGNVVRYGIEDGADWEVGTAVMSSSATVMARTVNESSNGGNALNLTSDAVVFGTLSAADFSNNAAPDFVNAVPSTLELTAGVVSTINAKALDDDGFPVSYSFDGYKDSTVYSASNLPPQLSAVSIDQTTGVFSLTATSSASGSGNHSFRVRASDGVRTATKTTVCSLSFLPTTGLTGLYDMKDSNSYSGTGTTWSDVSGNSGPNLTIDLSYSTYVANGLGGLPELDIDGSAPDGPVKTTSSALVSQTTGRGTVVLIFAKSNVPTARTFYRLICNGTANSLAMYGWQNNSAAALNTGTAINATAVAHPNSKLYLDSTDITSATSGDVYDGFDSTANFGKYHSLILTEAWLYNGFNWSNDWYQCANGHLRALIFYNRALTAGEAGALHAHFASDYSSSEMIQ